MCKKTFICSLFGALFFVCSCIDYNYDLANKEIATDVKIEGNKIALPVGSLKPVVLDSLVNIDEIEILEKTDGVYSITMKDSISVEESIEPIKLNIDPITKSIKIDEFKEANVSDVHIGAPEPKSTTFKTTNISLDDLNGKLPVLQSKVNKMIVTQELEYFFELLDKGMFNPSLIGSIPISATFSIEKEKVPCKLNYELPEQVEAIRSIKLGSKNDGKGTLVEVVVTHPEVLDGIDRKIDFEIIFPEMFVLAEASEVYEISQDGHTVSVNDLPANGASTKIDFYITEIVDVDKNTVEGVIDINEEIEYSLNYKLDGTLEPKSEMSRDDFEFNVNFNVPLSFRDITGSTKDIKVDFKPIDMHFEGDFDHLNHIDRIEYVEFDEAQSHIKFSADMQSDWLEYFKLKEGYALKISFPKNLEISSEHSVYGGDDDKIVYDAEKHAFYVYDLVKLATTDWDLAIKKLTINKDVDKTDEGNYKCHLDVSASVSFVNGDDEPVDYLILAGIEMESMDDVLDKLKGNKNATFVMSESDLVVKNAVVQTEVIHTNLKNEKVEFSLNEEIPSEIGRIDSIGFTKDVAMKFNVEILGLDFLDTDIDLVVKMNLPSFLELSKPENGNPKVAMEYKDGLLTIKAKHNPQNGNNLSFELLCTGLDFVNEEFGEKGLVPDMIDGKAYLSYSTDINFTGDVSIRGTEFHSQVLDQLNEISMNVEFVVDDIEVKTFHGIYSAGIEGVEEEIALDLGDELAFLKEEGNGITLAEPQLEFVVENTIGIPVDIDLQLFGKDENGNPIPTSVISKVISIAPAEYNEETDELKPVETKLFITNDTTKVNKVGYQNIQIENLANLLQKIPNSISINVKPIIKTEQTHHVDIGQPISLKGEYSVFVPLKFDDFNICYSDTITGLSESLGETIEMLSNISLKAKMNIVNTIPLSLSLKVTPLDADDKVLEDITIGNLIINAGLGGDIVDENGNFISEQTAQPFEFKISSRSGDISALDQLAFSIEATSGTVSGGVGLKGGQGIKITDIVFEVGGDIEVDFSELVE